MNGETIVLKPCPFCGAEAQFIDDDGYGECGVCCSSGLCEVEPYVSGPIGDEKNVAAAWNTRHKEG